MIKVTLGEQPDEKEEVEYPKLMQSDDYKKVVLFIRPHVGIMLTFNGKGMDLRKEIHSQYNMNLFTDYNEPVTLQNA